MPADRDNVVLTGFMGTGKSTVGRLVARELGCPFVDMDEVIEQRAGQKIPEIFRREGESGFRQRERALCEELGQRRGLVIATGGGALVDAHNRATMLRSGYTICLDCAEEELLRRLRGVDNRPMLSDDPRLPKSCEPAVRQRLRKSSRLGELLRSRQPAYAQIPYHIDTTGGAPAAVAQSVLQLVRSRPVHWDVSTPTGAYPVYLLPGGLDHLPALLAARGVGASRLAIVSDEHVWPLYGERLRAALEARLPKSEAIVLPAGEAHKTLDTVRTIYDRFVEAGLDRGSVVVALGGGVITDMAGFAAATFMRGLPLVQVPTTLLAMVDASVGGKVAVDHPRGKNLIGAFVQPLLVMVDPDLLATLPEMQRRSGLAEVIKAGVIGDVELFDHLAREVPGTSQVPGTWMRWAVERALQVKITIVEEDPYERGRRAVLNLGHTFAHAFEVLADYRLSHGLAVSMGMVAAAHLAELRRLPKSDRLRKSIADTLRRHGLPVTYADASPERVYQAMYADKKRRGSKLSYILPRAIGDVVVDADVPEEQVLAALERIRP